MLLGDHATETDRARLAAELHLDESLAQQYGRFLLGLLKFDLGPSIRRPDVGAIARVQAALWPTVSLASTAVAIGSTLGVCGALVARGPWFPRGRVWMSRLFIAVAAVPLLALSPVATYVLVIKCRLLPLPGDPDAGALGLLFPAVLLALPLGAHTARIGEEALARAERSPFLTVAKAKGAGAFRVWGLHALPTVVSPIVTTIAAQLGALLGGAVVLERLFERPGLGRLILEAYSERDLPVLEAAVAAAGLLFVVTQMAGAAVVAAVDPRARGR